MSFDVLNRWTQAVVYHSEAADNIAAAVCEAVKYGANLSRANLSGANLSGANLSRANLSGADLSRANLSGAMGLLNGVAPLQISGTMHQVMVRTPGIIQIGCESHPAEWWKEHYRAVGRANGYDKRQILEYREHIKFAHNWMKITGNCGDETKKESTA